MKIVIGNVVFAALVLGIFFLGLGGRQDFLRSVILVLCAFVAGTIVGFWLSRPVAAGPPPRRPVRRRVGRTALTPSPFDRIVE
jgi:hypothetical protein